MHQGMNPLSYQTKAESVTEEQVKALLRRYGWTPYTRAKPSGRYMSAVKWINGKHVQRYISAISRLRWLEPADVLAKLPDVA